MKNKKLRNLFIITLVVQLLIPVFLLSAHYANHKNVLEQSQEYKFKLLDMSLDVYSDGEQYLWFDVGGVHQYYGKKIAVTVGEDGFVDFAERSALPENDCWINFKYLRYRTSFSNNDFSIEPGVVVSQVMEKVYAAYAWASDMHENGCFAYVTAKVYKGAFVPTAVYVEGEKILTIHPENLM